MVKFCFLWAHEEGGDVSIQENRSKIKYFNLVDEWAKHFNWKSFGKAKSQEIYATLFFVHTSHKIHTKKEKAGTTPKAKNAKPMQKLMQIQIQKKKKRKEKGRKFIKIYQIITAIWTTRKTFSYVSQPATLQRFALLAGRMSPFLLIWCLWLLASGQLASPSHLWFSWYTKPFTCMSNRNPRQN